MNTCTSGNDSFQEGTILRSYISECNKSGSLLGKNQKSGNLTMSLRDNSSFTGHINDNMTLPALLSQCCHILY